MLNELSIDSIDNLIKNLDSGQMTAQDIMDYAIEINADFLWHPLGFIKSKIMDVANRQIRLHIWPRDEKKFQHPQWMIHDHIFNLNSWVLKGEVLNTLYDITQSEDYDHCLYSVLYDGEKSILKKTNVNVKVSESSRNVIKDGGKYNIPAKTLHSTISVYPATSITVCETFNISNENPLVVGEIDGDEKYTYFRYRVSQHELEKHMFMK